MNYLLDTNGFLHWTSAQHKLPPAVLRACTDHTNTLIVSVASIWEIQTKMAIERVKMRWTLPIDGDAALAQIIADQQANGVEFRPILARHVRRMATLPWHHKDPFDRIIIGTALADTLTLISADAAFPRYMPDGLLLF